MLLNAAFASRVVELVPTLMPRARPALAGRCGTHGKTGCCVLRCIRHRVYVTGEESAAAAASATLRNGGRRSESTGRHGIARSESKPLS